MRHRAFILGAICCLCLLPSRAQPQQGPVAPQPGLRWTEDQLNKVAHHVRAGCTLTPKSWPNGARVAVCLTFDPDDFSIQLSRGDTNVVGISLGEYAPLTGIPRLLKLGQRNQRLALKEDHVRYRILIVVVMVSACIVVGVAQQQTPQDNQPGRKWSAAQLGQASSAVRAGGS